MGKELKIARWHENADDTTELTYLPNESTDPDYVVFTTDKFSDYALVYDSVGAGTASTGTLDSVAGASESSSMNLKAIIIAAIVALAALITSITVIAFKKIDKD